MNKWAVSVIVPVYNGAAFIAEALASIAAQGTRLVSEVIVVDDGSTDATPDIVRSATGPVRYFRQDNAGPQIARNAGLAKARGNAIAFLDADDCWSADKLAVQLPLLDDADIAIGHTRIMHDPSSQPFILPSMCCSLIRKSAFDKIGAFDPELACSDDMDWYLRAREDGLSFRIHPQVVLQHRRHAANLTRDGEAKERYHLLMLHKSILRRRAKGITDMPRFTDFFTDTAG